MSKPSSASEESFLQSLDRYWFGRGSPVTLGVIRIAVGILAFVNSILIGTYWESWFSERGFTPQWVGQVWLYPMVKVLPNGWELPRINLLNGVTDPRITIPFFVITALAAITTAFGLWTRVSTFVLAIGVVSLQHRNAAILHGGDTVLRVLVLYLAISPCGNACSLDRVIAIWRGRISGALESVSLWPQRLISYNLALVYFTTVWLKWQGSHWRDGTATHYPARLAEFYRFPVPEFVNNPPFIYFTTYGTLFVEFALATFVFFRPLRRYVIISGVLMHLYIEYSMNIPLFSFLMITCYLAFYDGEELTACARRIGARLRKFAITARYPAGTQLRPSAAEFLSAVDPLGLVSYAPGTEDVWRATGAKSSASPVFATWSRSLGAWSFAWIPGIWKRLLEKAPEPVEISETVAEKPSKRKNVK